MNLPSNINTDYQQTISTGKNVTFSCPRVKVPLLSTKNRFLDKGKYPTSNDLKIYQNTEQILHN